MNSLPTPKVSVIIPVFNAAKYLQEALDSVSQQTYQNIEIIALNDGSTDNSLQILEGHMKRDSRLIVISRENRGLGATLNELISTSRSELIARMDADDICTPMRIERQVNYMIEHPQHAIIGGQIEFIIDSNSTLAFPMHESHQEIRRELLKGRFPLCHPAVLFKKCAAERIGCYRVLGAGEDLDFFLRISEVGLAGNVPDLVLKYRIALNSLSTTRATELRMKYAWAIFNAEQRLQSKEEISLPEFEKNWNQRSFIKKLNDQTHIISEIYYRRSIALRARGNTLFFWPLYLVAAAALRPITTVNKAIDYCRLQLK